MVISKSITILAILVILVLFFANSDLIEFWNAGYWILNALIILICLCLLWNLFQWIRLKVKLIQVEFELSKIRQENVRLLEETLQLQEQFIHRLHEYNSHLIRLLLLNVENSEHLDNEDLDQADEIEIIYETCTYLC